MTTDARLEAFLSDQAEVFSGVQQGENLWKPDPFDVESINAPARAVFKRLIERAVRMPPPDVGKLLLLRGESGSGKTHLVRAFRSLVHGQGLGYVGYLPMTVDTPHYERYVLTHLIDSLDRPYDSPESESGLMRLSSSVMSLCTSAFAPLITAEERVLEEDELHGMVSGVVYDLQESDARFRAVDVDLLRALLFLQYRDVRLHHSVLQWLRCKELALVDRRILTELTPRTGADDPKWMLEQLGRLMGVLHQALVLCVDQVEDISDFKARPDMEPPFRQAMNVMAHLAGNLPSAVVVLCCLTDFWVGMSHKLTRSMRDRIEHDPEPVDLDVEVSADMARDIAARRLEALYASCGAPFDPSDPTWPFPTEGFKALSGRRTRDVLDEYRRYRERAIQTQRLPEHFPLPEPSGPQTRKLPEVNTSLVQLERDWTNFRSAFPAQAPTEEAEVVALLAWALETGSGELESAAPYSIEGRDAGTLDITLHPSGTRVRIVVCNKAAQGGHLVKQMKDALQATADRRPLFVRTTEFPKTISPLMAELLPELQKKGGRRLVLGDGELRELVALRMFRMAHAESVMREWSRTTRPITRMKLVRDVLGPDRSEGLPVSPPPAPLPPAPPSPVRPPPAPIPPGIRARPTTLPLPLELPVSRAPLRPGSVSPSASEPPATSVATTQTPAPAFESSSGPLRVGTQEGIFSRPVTVEPNELTRHSAFLGGTGSGKTTLALNVLEQLLLRGVPAILVDRKGDLAGYARPESWTEPLDDALDERRRLLRERVDVALYTPGRSDGRPLAIPVVPRGLDSLPPDEQDQGVQQAADAVAGMLEYKSNPRDRAARALLGQALRLLVQRPLGRELTLELLQQFVQSEDPALVQEAEGLDPKAFQKLVQDLAMLRLNTRVLLSASGERLDLDELLGRGAASVPGRTRLSIISTKFLGSTSSVLFWVSQLLLETHRWASHHPSTKLQAVLLFDEADLYLPAMSQPATKQPLENLLKRARSAGIGVMLATQSPGDLDYKCRENVRTWFVGRVKEETALKKLRPMFSDARGGDATLKLANQKTGQFHVQRDGQVQQLKADRNIILTTQLPEEEILRLASQTRPSPTPP